MRIAQVVECSGGGTGRHVIDVSAGLSAKGHDVVLFYSERRIESNFNSGLEKLDDVRKIQIPFRRQIGFHDFFHLRELTRQLEDYGPFDVVHGHSSKAGALVRLLPRKLKVGRVYSPHAVRTMDPTLPPVSRAFFHGVERALGRLPARFAVGSNDEISALRSLGISRDRIDLLDFGISPSEPEDRQELRREFALPVDRIVVGMVGRLEWQKAPERAIRGFARIHGGSAHLAIVGDGPLLTDLRRLVAELDIAERVSFLGYQNGERLMPAFDLLVMPSRYESSPYVLLEAIMATVPVITTPVGMAADLFAESTAGLLVENTDCSAQWSEAIVRFMDPIERKAAVSAAVELCTKRNLGTMVGQVEEVYLRSIAQLRNC